MQLLRQTRNYFASAGSVGTVSSDLTLHDIGTAWKSHDWRQEELSQWLQLKTYMKNNKWRKYGKHRPCRKWRNSTQNDDTNKRNEIPNMWWRFTLNYIQNKWTPEKHRLSFSGKIMTLDPLDSFMTINDIIHKYLTENMPAEISEWKMPSVFHFSILLESYFNAFAHVQFLNYNSEGSKTDKCSSGRIYNKKIADFCGSYGWGKYMIILQRFRLKSFQYFPPKMLTCYHNIFFKVLSTLLKVKSSLSRAPEGFVEIWRGSSCESISIDVLKGLPHGPFCFLYLRKLLIS